MQSKMVGSHNISQVEGVCGELGCVWVCADFTKSVVRPLHSTLSRGKCHKNV